MRQGKAVTDFFISYTSVDRSWAEWIAWVLEEAKYTTIVQTWDFGVGANFVQEMDAAAQKAERTIAVLSPDYFQSKFTPSEWHAAFRRDPTGVQRLLVPVRVRECDVDGLLGGIVYIDLVGLEAEVARDTLLAGVQRQRAKPTREPGFPGPSPRLGTAPPLFPGAIPQNLPRSGAAAFVGRAQELDRLHQQLHQSDRLAITAIAGMGGIGKTELALQYAQEHWQQGTYAGGVCWLQARQVELNAHVSLDLGTQIVQFAQSRLQLYPPDALDLTAQIAFCWHHWRAGDVLVVFDDVTDYAVIQPYLPPTDPRFKVVITTRKDFGRSVASMAIDVLDLDAALELLERLVGGEQVQATQEIAHDLCERLGYLPLGLELVGRYLARKPDLSLAQMRQRLVAKGLRSTALAQTEVGMTARLGVTAAFELSWESLSESTQRLGCLLSVLAGAPIPWFVVEACCAEVDPEELEEIRDRELVGFNLLQRDALGVYRVHTLIREFLQGKLQQRADADALKHAVCQWAVSVAHHIPQTPTRDLIEAVTPLIPHMAEVATSFIPWVHDEDLIWLFTGVSRFYTGQGDYAQAVPWNQQSLLVTQRRLGEAHPDVATSLDNLAQLYTAQGRYSEAEPLCLGALAMRKRLLGEAHPHVAASLDNLAELYRAQGRYSEAEPLYRDALAMWKQLLGETHPDVAISLNNLALLYRVQGRYSEAEPLYRDALAMRKRLLGETHPHVAISLNNLAGLYHAQGRYSEAEPLYHDALAMRKRLLGETHPHVAISLNNLAGLYHAQGRYSEAEPLYHDALAMWKQLLGETHPHVATSLDNLAGLYYAQGRYSEAEPLYQRALTLREQVLRVEHSDVAASLNNLAELYRVQGRYSEAEPLCLGALAMRKRLLGETHPDVATSLNNLALLYRVQRRYSEAEPLYHDALAMWKQLLGETHPHVATSLDNLAEFYVAQGRYSEAEPLYRDALAMRKRLLGEAHPHVATSLNNLAGLYYTQGRYSEAEPLYRDALAMRKRLLGEAHPDVAVSLNNLAVLYANHKQFEKAAPLLEQAVRIFRQLLGDEHPNTQILKQTLEQVKAAMR